MTSALTPVSQPIKPKSPFKTTTFWFAVLAAAVHVGSDWKNPTVWGEGIGIVGAAYGARKAISKNGTGD